MQTNDKVLTRLAEIDKQEEQLKNRLTLSLLL
ncbi:hypothetical protein GAB14E_3852 [Colwellia psychrerythraea]|uniref:Uncharacterized protein n=1 Tax=Colwellia psychrerythraea TaxID=28229 RepID=A0A099KH77_COLPS|nr:hypothetical protein GAB14E_3852 [Colwellia psychrerythraea]